MGPLGGRRAETVNGGRGACCLCRKRGELGIGLHGMVEVEGDGAGLAVEVDRLAFGPSMSVDEDDQGGLMIIRAIR